MDWKSTQAVRGPKSADAPVPKISVVIPLYYAEDYVSDLFTWLCNQPLKEIEVICVIDGSPDGTLALVREHAERDSRIKCLYQDNAGAGAARNAGLKVARGDYLLFVDADDLCDPRLLSKMHESATAHDADLVVCLYDRTDFKTGREGRKVGFRMDRVPAGKAFAAKELESPFADFSVGPTNKLFRREMIECEGLRFSETRVANDVCFVLQSIALSQRIVAIPESLIEVRRYVNPHSISSHRAQHADDVFAVLQDLYEWLCERGLYERYGNSYLDAWSDCFHYNATYGATPRFIETAIKTLGTKEPWRSMDDKKLFDAARLNTGMLVLKRAIVSFLTRKENRELELQRIDNELTVVKEVTRHLNADYGRTLPERPSLPSGVISHLRRTGMRYNFSNLTSRIKGRFSAR